MSYMEYQDTPDWEPVQIDAQGNRVPPAIEGRLSWSGKAPPPKIGELVMVRMNRIGISWVTGYFSERGFLGLRIVPLSPPEWYVRQNGVNAVGHVFGAEVQTIPATSRHTKGPWHVGEGNGEGSVFADNGRMRCEGATVLYPICTVTQGWNEEEDLANAALLAASPELFIALERTLKALERFLPHDYREAPGDTNEETAAIAAHIAIAKAKLITN